MDGIGARDGFPPVSEFDRTRDSPVSEYSQPVSFEQFFSSHE